MRRRLRRLESLQGGGSLGYPDPEGYSGTAAEIREIDRRIAELEAEITEAGMSPEEVERSRAEAHAFMESLEGLSLDEKIEALEAEIAQPKGPHANRC